LKNEGNETRPGVHNILLATDFSAFSETALFYAAAVAQRSGAALHVIHVLVPEAMQYFCAETMPIPFEQLREGAERQMIYFLQSEALKDVPHRAWIEEGPVWEALQVFMATHNIDLLVVATHGRTGLKKLLLGSVAEEIIRLSPCPVLAVGPQAERDRASAIREILFATDFSKESLAALPFALDHAQKYGAHLTLLHVVPEPGRKPLPDRDRVTTYLQEQLKALLPKEASNGHEPDCLVKIGQAAEMILQTAGEIRADMIVLGVNPSGVLPGHSLGTTVYKVVCEASCPVLTAAGETKLAALQQHLLAHASD
jgi:nucleotide-binding universal stress UspA family protein